MRTAPVTLATSSEFLRLALPLMSKYDVPVTPPNYAVWYAYVSGGNVALKEAIDNLLAQAQPIDESMTERLYRLHVDPTDPARFDEAERSLKTLAENVAVSLKTATGEVYRYEQSLQDCTSELSGEITPERLKTLVVNLSQSTQKMTAGHSELSLNLEESRREAESLRQELAKARAEAQTDVLTGLANRKAFEDRVAELEQSGQRAAGVHCLLIADIDHFKSVNDTYGHLFGDRVLKSVAQVLKQLIKGKDMAARFGGEEFVVLLPDTPIAGGTAVAESIRKAIENGRVVNMKTGQEIRKVTVSIGVTQLAEHETVVEALAKADAALYRAKDGGRNRVEAHVAGQLPAAVAFTMHRNL